MAGKGQNSRPPATLAEPRTDREQHVLRYLASTLSNAEIASEFYLSINTVKTHQRMVYRKLAPTDGVTLCAARRNCACSDLAVIAVARSKSGSWALPEEEWADRLVRAPRRRLCGRCVLWCADAVPRLPARCARG